MGRINDIAVICHDAQTFRQDYHLAYFAERWRSEGRRIHIHHGLGMPPSADAAFLHVDLTHVPESYLKLMGCYSVAINVGTADISKRRVSRRLVSMDDDYEGPVVVKTDLNYLGHPEHEIPRRRGRIPRFVEKVKDRLPPRVTGRLPGYLFFEQKAEVPRWIWRSPGLVVERLCCERHGELYVLRQWLFLGHRSVVTIFHALSPFVKLSNVVERRPLEYEVPAALQRRREELGFDYGKFDYVMLDGEPVLLDANRTPNIGAGAPAERWKLVLDALAPGIDDFAETLA